MCMKFSAVLLEFECVVFMVVFSFCACIAPSAGGSHLEH